MPTLSSMMPWRLKILTKIILARLPISTDLWRKMGLFRHGKMESAEYAYRIFRRHLDRTRFQNQEDAGYTMLELGPGDSLFSALFAKAHGAKRSTLVDVGPFALEELEPFHDAEKYLKTQGVDCPSIKFCKDLGEVLRTCDAQYKTAGLQSLKDIPSESVDFVWSQAVLEHVHAGEFLETMQEVHRILRPGGVSSHRIDLRDHLGGKLNNLRVSKERWESNLYQFSGFYTNRIRYQEMLNLFEQAGLSAEVVQKNTWNALPTPRSVLRTEFQNLAEEDLLVSGFDVVLTPKVQTAASAA